MARTPRVSLLAAFALVALVVWACGRNPLDPLSFNNRPPEVRILAAPATIIGENVTHQVRWEASDVDGRIDHYLVAVTPSTKGGTPTWTRSERTDLAVTLPTKQAAKRAHGADPAAEPEFTIVSVRAVDDRGATSESAQLALFAENQPPTVTITSPLPSSLTTSLLPGHFDIRWTGNDPDGGANHQPTQYRHRLFTDGPAPADFGFPVLEANFIDFIRSNPDSFRRGYAPAFPGWTTVGPATRELHLEGLTVARSYLFAVTAFDEAGDYDPVFNLNKNLLRMYVISDDDARPAIHLFNEFFDYRYSNGSQSTDPSRQIPLTIRSDQRVTIRWDGTPAPSSSIVKTRTFMGVEGAPTPPGGEWSRWLGQHSIQVGPFPDGQVRLLYVEIEDNRGLTSIGIVRIHPVNLSAKRPLLIVDDTRLLPDNVTAGVVAPPSGAWPTAAELDTFLFAVGGFPWKGYPAGTTSTPGIFSGYDYDTLGTRVGRNDLSVPLETLARYENVIWIVDQEGAGNTSVGTNPLRPMTALRYMTAAGRYNSLAAYVELGGRLWLTGGGAARATLLDWQVPNTTPQFCANDHELGPGRMMYDQAHWRSCINAASVSNSGRVVRSAGATGNWPGGPNVALLPTELVRRSATSDPIPPLRQASNFYSAFFWYEYLSMPNAIVEPHIGSGSVLDTLYQVSGGTVPAGVIRPTMTVYHGHENAPFIFSGFDLWSFRRSDCEQLLDAVLGGGWGLPRQTNPGARRIASATPPSPDVTRR